MGSKDKIKVESSSHAAAPAPYQGEDRMMTRRMYWPNPDYTADPRSLYDELPEGPRFPIVSPATPIGSSGSCFAMEIAYRLQENKFNYVITERDRNRDPQKELVYSNAAWGTIFNTPSFRQLIERSFGVLELPRLLDKTERRGKTVYQDVFRNTVFFDSMEEWEADYDLHIAKAREALTACEVFVITLGMNEVWRMRDQPFYFPVCPWGFTDVVSEVLTVEKNVRELQRMLDLWRRHNPRLKLIVSVSPIPLQATFRSGECSVITANCHSKSTLRVVAEEFVRANKDVYYFPSYETVMYCTRNAWDSDQRHASRQAVDKVMQLFDKTFVTENL